MGVLPLLETEHTQLLVGSSAFRTLLRIRSEFGGAPQLLHVEQKLGRHVFAVRTTKPQGTPWAAALVTSALFQE